MKARRSAAVVVCAAALAMAGPARGLDEAAAERALAVAGDKLARAAARLGVDQLPKSTGPDGLWRTVAATDRVGWTQGFFPGSLWYLHELTGEGAWRERAERFTWPLEPQSANAETHDTGFKLLPSFGNAHRLTGDPAYRDVLLAGAASLASRFRPEVGAIDCCDWNPDWRLPVVIDTMMNVELLLWAAQHGGDPGYTDLALRHALRTRADLVRADGSTFHVADYEPGTGALRWRGTFQGAADDSTWSRGQAWAVYGFTVVHRYTGDGRMLDAAQRTAEFFLTRLPAHGVPSWDLDAGGQEDSSAAAILAAALLELATFVAEPGATRYRGVAHAILGTLASTSYLDARATTEGILLHGAGHVPAGQEVDVSLVYGDYYFVEALLRARPWVKTPAGEDGGGDAGVGDGGDADGGDGGDGADGGGGVDDGGGVDGEGGEAEPGDTAGDAGGGEGGGGVPDGGGGEGGGGTDEPDGATQSSRRSGGCSTGGAAWPFALALLALRRARRA